MFDGHHVVRIGEEAQWFRHPFLLHFLQHGQQVHRPHSVVTQKQNSSWSFRCLTSFPIRLFSLKATTIPTNIPYQQDIIPYRLTYHTSKTLYHTKKTLPYQQDNTIPTNIPYQQDITIPTNIPYQQILYHTNKDTNIPTNILYQQRLLYQQRHYHTN